MHPQTIDKAKFHIVLVQGVVIKDGKYLLGQRSHNELQDPGEWGIPGGKVEKEKESEENILFITLRKEIMEEVGVEVYDEFVLISNGSFTRKDGAHVVGLVFLVKYKSGDPKPGEDTIAVKWMDINEVRNTCLTHVVNTLEKAEIYRKKNNYE